MLVLLASVIHLLGHCGILRTLF